MELDSEGKRHLALKSGMFTELERVAKEKAMRD